MGQKDARKLSASLLTDLRTRAVQAVLDGESPEIVARIMGVHRSTMYGWLSKYTQGGFGALNAKKRGGRKPLLDKKTIKWLHQVIIKKNPLQLHFPFALWTSRMVSRLIFQKFGIRMSKASTCRLMKQMGLSPQRPLWKAYQQNPVRVEQWLQKDFPKIQKMAKKEGAQIYFCDEAGVKSNFHWGTTWAPIGETPVIKSTGQRFGCNLISAVTNRGDMRFMITEDRITSKVFVKFLKRMITGNKKPIYLIVDGYSIHKTKMVEKYVVSTNGMLKLFELPAYSPELNPDELVWANLKKRSGRKVFYGLDTLKKEVHSDMKSIQKSKSHVLSFFQTPTTQYASW